MVMLDITWSDPYKTKIDNVLKMRREWCIPKDKLNSFFIYWNSNKFELLKKGFSISKSKVTGKWYVFDTKDNISLFLSFSSSIKKEKIDSKIIDNNVKLQPYAIKNNDGLRPWQIEASSKLVSAINTWGSSIDGSDLGTGKSYSAIGVVRELDCPFIVVCPKSVKHQWESVIKDHFKINNKSKGIINYELLIRGRKDSDIASFVLDRKTRRKKFTWKLPKNSIIIYDEAHKLKNFSTQNSKVCLEAHKQGYRMLFLSASIASSPIDLRTVGICLGMFKTSKEYNEWAENHGVYYDMWGPKFNNNPIHLKKINKYLFEDRGVRKRRDEIPNFPEFEIIVQAYDINEEKTNEINKNYNDLKNELKRLDTLIKKEESKMVIRLRYRQKIELLKSDLLVELAQEGLDAGMSIILFVNYTETINALSSKLNTTCVFDGKVGDNIRIENLRKFQANESRVIIVQAKSGSTGLNMGDIDGKHPRMAVISPDDDAVIIRQCTGRPVRENSKSKSIIKIPFINNTIEADVVDNMKIKLDNIDTINNYDIDPLQLK